MAHPTSPIWDRPIPDLRSRLQASVDNGCSRLDRQAEIFFRADDVAAPGSNLTRLMGLFSEFRSPLALAVVPAWLTNPRWEKLAGFERKTPGLWSWHQHGWRHVDHERAGKKSEFGPARTERERILDLSLGRNRLKDLIGDRFLPVFTPPWNRCGLETLNLLPRLGFAAVSRKAGARPKAPEGLIEIDVHVDLHTRKEKNPAADRERLFEEIEGVIAAGRCGFMLHHQRINGRAFEFLDLLLQVLSGHPRVRLVGFDQLV